LIKSQDYLFRISALRGLIICSKILQSERKIDELFQIILKSVQNEGVPNVKMEITGTVEKIKDILNDESLKQARDRLE